MTADSLQRKAALDPSKSFIVQAPAGSGKTELLIQRCLLLLGTNCEAPEELLAITFTRKAALEMRERIIDALSMAKGAQPTEAHKLNTWHLAQKVLKRDEQLNWQLLETPSRIRTMTIDAFCAQICKQLPITTHMGGQPSITDNITRYAELAVERVLMLLEDTNDEISHALSVLLRHLNNQRQRVQELLIEMLMHREQWLPLVYRTKHDDNARDILQSTLAALVKNALVKLDQAFPFYHSEKLSASLAFATNELAKNSEAEVTVYHPESPCPEPESDTALDYWLATAELLLTTEGSWRKRFTVKQGFPAPSSTSDKALKAAYQSQKTAITELVAALENEEDFRKQLHELRQLPPVEYSESQWLVIEALMHILPVLCAELKLVFTDAGEVDFTEVSQAALFALQDIEGEEVKLKLDYQIKHLLVDEVQDISNQQGILLSQLTEGFTPGDGRTVFLVGDPMQSIYRFRQAEVSLFMHMQTSKRIGMVPLETIYLQSNFRSRPAVIDWVNRSFSQLFPKSANYMTGAVPYAHSIAERDSVAKSGVTIHPLSKEGHAGSADAVAGLIKNIKSTQSDASIAVLVRSRRHLNEIIPKLKQNNIVFSAVDIEPLNQLMCVQDCISLTLALLYPGSRLYWLSVLRAPWCGLCLKDLLVASDEQLSQSVYFTLLEHLSTDWQDYSEDGRAKLSRVFPILKNAVNERNRLSLSNWIQTTWLRLGGPATLNSEAELQACQQYFERLNQLERISPFPKASELYDFYAAQYAEQQLSTSNPVHLMTIHKSKGLEFDVVIIPHLEKRPMLDKSKLLNWSELNLGDDYASLALAPIKSADEQSEKISQYIQLQERKKSNYESLRLLYVGATRAKQQLHLFGEVAIKDDEIIGPSQESFLGHLWPVLSNDYYAMQIESTEPEVFDKLDYELAAGLTSLPKAFNPGAHLRYPQPDDLDYADNPEINWYTLVSKETEAASSKLIGAFLHRLLHRVHLDGLALWQGRELSSCVGAWSAGLKVLGLSNDEIPTAVEICLQGLEMTLADKQGRWLLNNSYDESQSEFAVKLQTTAGTQHFVIDRMFVECGVRWIVDYKSSLPHEHQNLSEFLQQEREKYASQLTSYADIFSELDEPIKLGLYFPLCGQFIHWEYACERQL